MTHLPISFCYFGGYIAKLFRLLKITIFKLQHFTIYFWSDIHCMKLCFYRERKNFSALACLTSIKCVSVAAIAREQFSLVIVFFFFPTNGSAWVFYTLSKQFTGAPPIQRQYLSSVLPSFLQVAVLCTPRCSCWTSSMNFFYELS